MTGIPSTDAPTRRGSAAAASRRLERLVPGSHDRIPFMRKAAAVLVIGIPVASILYAGVVAPYTDCRVTVRDGVLRLDLLPENRVFAAVLDRFSVEPERLDDALIEPGRESFFLSGRVVSNNTGFPVQGVVVWIRAPGQAAYLAGMSDVDGEFRFRVWVDAAVRTSRTGAEAQDISLYLPSITEGDLLLGGELDRNRVLAAGTVSRYRLAELTAAAKSATSGD